MAISIHRISVYTYVRHLTGLANCLKKTQALYAEKKYDEATLLSYRFYPNMFNFAKQVQAATDHARTSSAQLAGQEPPKYEDNEKSLVELIARVEKTIAYLNSIKPEQLAGAEEKSVVIKMRSGDVTFRGLELVQDRAMPNFYFHCTTAYDIMRHNGVDLGKRDFMGG